MKHLLYVAVSGEDKITVFEINPSTGEIDKCFDVAVPNLPYPLALNPNGRYLYIGRQNTKEISTFSIDSNTGNLSILDSLFVDADPCYFSIDKTGKYLLSAYYVGSKIQVHSVGEDGIPFGAPVETRDIGYGAHSFSADPQNKFAFASCIAGEYISESHKPENGADAIFQFKFNELTGQLLDNTPFKIVPDGQVGPRHFCFNPKKSVVYFSNEQGCSVTSYNLDPILGTITPFQTISTLPDGFEGDNTCSQIQISPAGNFLYAPNRGHDSIACFSVNEFDGSLKYIQNVSTESEPRAINIHPQGKFIYVAGENSGMIAAYMVNRFDGTLDLINTYYVGKSPMWISTLLL
jgi:6-phosphogluconolactonase